MSKYNLVDILNEYIGGGRIGTLRISYKDLVDKMDELEKSGKVIVREKGSSADGKVNREFEVVDRNSPNLGTNKQERGFTVYDYKFGFDPGDQDNFTEEYDFSVGGNDLQLAMDLIDGVKAYRIGDFPSLKENIAEGNLDDLRKLKDDLSGALEGMKKKAKELKLDVDFGDVTQAVNKYIDDVFDADYKRSGGRIDEEKNGMKLSKKNYADYHKDNKKKVDELSMGKKDKDDDGESKFRSAQYGIGDAFVEAVKKRMQKEMQTLPNPIMRRGFEGDNYQEKETERMRRDGSSGESQKSMASVPFYQRDVRYDDDFFIDELNDGELDESFDSLVKKVDKAKGYSKKDAQRVAGFIANRKRAGAGSGPTKKMKKREGIKEAPGSTINLSKDDMDKLHSDGQLNIDGHKVIYKVNENGDVKDYTDEIKESSQEESLANYLIKSYTNPKTGTSLVDDEMVSDFMRTVPEWEDMFDGSEEGNDSIDKEFQDFLFLNYDSLDEVKDKKEMVKLEEHFKRFR